MYQKMLSQQVRV